MAVPCKCHDDKLNDIFTAIHDGSVPLGAVAEAVLPKETLLALIEGRLSPDAEKTHHIYMKTRSLNQVFTTNDLKREIVKFLPVTELHNAARISCAWRNTIIHPATIATHPVLQGMHVQVTTRFGSNMVVDKNRKVINVSPVNLKSAYFENLRRISLHRPGALEPDLDMLTFCDKLEILETKAVSNSMKHWKELEELLRQCRKIHTLIVHDDLKKIKDVHDRNTLFISRIWDSCGGKFRKLKVFKYVPDTATPPLWLKAMPGAVAFTNLRALSLGACRFAKNVMKLTDVLDQVQDLRILDLWGCQWEDTVDLKRYPNLRVLSLSFDASRQPVSFVGSQIRVLQYQARWYFKTLERLKTFFELYPELEKLGPTFVCREGVDDDMRTQLARLGWNNMTVTTDVLQACQPSVLSEDDMGHLQSLFNIRSKQ